MSDHVVNIQKIGQHNDIIKISIDKGVEVTEAMPFLVQLLDNCFKNGMYKVIFDMERIKFPSPSFIAFLIEITAQSRRVGGNVILIRIPHSAINNFVTFSPLNYLATEETDSEAIEELEILTPKLKKNNEFTAPPKINEIIVPKDEKGIDHDLTDSAIPEEKIKIKVEEIKPPQETEIITELPLPSENILEPQSKEIKPEKAEKLTVEQNIFRLKEPKLPVKEIISEVAAEEKLPTERNQPAQKNIQVATQINEKPVERQKTMSREEVQKLIAELRKQIEQQPDDIDFSDLTALQDKSQQDKVFQSKSNQESNKLFPGIKPEQESEVNIPAESILNQPITPTTDQTSIKKETSQENKKVQRPSQSKPQQAIDGIKFEIKEETDPNKPKAFRIRVKSQIESLYKICDFVINLASQAGIPEKERGKLKVTVYEASLNVIEHAYHSDPDEWIVVTVQIDPQRFVIIIQDWGESFNFDDSKKYDVTKAVQDRKTGGFGLFIIQRAMDQVQYKTDPLNGNRLILIKNLAPFKNM